MQLLDALRWSLDLGVKAITLYAFSIDNFRRESQEVDALMVLAEQKLLDILQVSCHLIATCRAPVQCCCCALSTMDIQNQELIETHQVQVRVLGDLSLLPDRVQQAATRVMTETSQNDACFLNICMAYT